MGAGVQPAPSDGSGLAAPLWEGERLGVGSGVLGRQRGHVGVGKGAGYACAVGS